MAARRGGDSGLLRIIGGRWRGRKLRFAALPGVRPTPDRVRETLFNWLAPHIHDARCIDLFAGSGALGLEALSRGAASACFVDSNAAALGAIRRHLAELEVTAAECRAGDALRILAAGNSGERWDIAFLDPPFGADLLAPAAAALEEGGWLAEGALVYLEAGAREPVPELPGSWQLHREKTAGDVRFSLFVRTGQFV